MAVKFKSSFYMPEYPDYKIEYKKKKKEISVVCFKMGVGNYTNFAEVISNLLGLIEDEDLGNEYAQRESFNTINGNLGGFGFLTGSKLQVDTNVDRIDSNQDNPDSPNVKFGFWNDNMPILESDEFKLSQEFCQSSENSDCQHRDETNTNPIPKKLTGSTCDYDFGRLINTAKPFSKDYCGYLGDDTEDGSKKKSNQTRDSAYVNVATPPTTVTRRGKTFSSSDKNGESENYQLQLQKFDNENCMYRGNEFVNAHQEIYPNIEQNSFECTGAQLNMLRISEFSEDDSPIPTDNKKLPPGVTVSSEEMLESKVDSETKPFKKK